MANIIILEDDFIQADDLKIFLEESGHTATVAGTGIEAISRCSDAAYDLAIVDMFVKYAGSYATDGGIYFITRLRQEKFKKMKTNKLIPIIAISGSGWVKHERNALTNAISAGADAALEKPFQKAELLNMVEKLLAKHTNGN